MRASGRCSPRTASQGNPGMLDRRPASATARRLMEGRVLILRQTVWLPPSVPAIHNNYIIDGRSHQMHYSGSCLVVTPLNAAISTPGVHAP